MVRRVGPNHLRRHNNGHLCWASFFYSNAESRNWMSLQTLAAHDAPAPEQHVGMCGAGMHTHNAVVEQHPRGSCVVSGETNTMLWLRAQHND